MNQMLRQAFGLSEFQLAVLIVSVLFMALIITGVHFWRRWEKDTPRGPAGVEPDQPWPRPPAKIHLSPRPLCQSCGGPVSDLIAEHPYFCKECRGPAYYCLGCVMRIGAYSLTCLKHMSGKEQRAEGA